MMNTSQLKSYAPAARKAFIAAVTAQAGRLGITAQGCETPIAEGDVLLVVGQAFPVSIQGPREQLVKRVKAQGFQATMEAIAYTWFNRLVALRFMELRGYLDHGYRVLSHPEGRGLPEILDHAVAVDLPGLDREQAIALKLDGTQDERLYRLLLIAQCNALHEAMPFLFERIGDETELLLPGNLLQTDSLIRQLVEGIDEEVWEQIEIIGWLYQFYISDRKEEVIGKVVQSADIPAATQLFTPNWIVKYMVQNSLGAQWLATYPDSPLKGQMEFYIEPAEQSPEVLAQLREITPSSLDPEGLTLIDPACGSGHILVEAYDLFKAIYLERGYRLRDVPKLILEKNLFGLDICPRAVQLTGFALMMKGRADDRRLFERNIVLNVRVFEDSTDFEPSVMVKGLSLADYGVQSFDLAEVKGLFENATVFGSLIQIPERLAKVLPGLRRLGEAVTQDLFVNYALRRLGVLVRLAEMLAAKYDVVVANPPYMGNKGMNGVIKKFLQDNYKDVKSDLFSVFVVRLTDMIASGGFAGFMTPFTWMFLSSYEKLRSHILDNLTLTTLVKPSYTAFFDSAIVAICTYTIRKNNSINFKGTFFDLDYLGTAEEQAPRFLRRKQDRQFYNVSAIDFKKIPGTAIAYWISQKVLEIFSTSTRLEDIAEPRQGLATADNDRFLRLWFEVSSHKIGFGLASRKEAQKSEKKWFPYNKGGEFRKWYGNQEYVVNWENDGFEIRNFGTENGGKSRSRPQNTDSYFKESITWSFISSSSFGVRYSPQGFIFDVGGSSLFTEKDNYVFLTSLLSSKIAFNLMKVMNPTLNFQVGNVASIPIVNNNNYLVDNVGYRNICLSQKDWNSYETSWDFTKLSLISEPLLDNSEQKEKIFPLNKLLSEQYKNTRQQWAEMTLEMQQLEEENNRIFIEAYGLQDELSPDVPLKEITLTCNPYYRYSKEATQPDKTEFPHDPDLETRLRQDTMQELVSYAVGCMMGRYSLDKPGLIYAHSENKDFDPSQYPTFPADDDGIIPLTDSEWFTDDATNRLIEFIRILLGTETLETNLNFLADNLNPKKDETSHDTLRRYLCDNFFKDHLQTYKKRPIYWLFSSGKQKA